MATETFAKVQHSRRRPRRFSRFGKSRSHEPQPFIQAIGVERLDIVEEIPREKSAPEWLRRTLLLLFFGAMAAFSWVPIANHLFHPPGDNKDYDIWYKAGRSVFEGRNLYTAREQAGRRVFEFMYPPAAAVFLAPLTAFGKLPFLVFIDLVNSLSWIGSLVLAVRLAGKTGVRPSLGSYVFPAVCTVAYVYDAYLLGQPNLLLLACLLAAFAALRQKHHWTAGALLAFATACKAFPALALGYLVYRRQWRAAAAMLVFLALLLFLLPAPVRGVGRTVREFETWASGMLLHYDDTSIAQRPGTSYEWKNASLLATSHRLLRHVPAELSDDDKPVFVNLADLSFPCVTGIALGLAVAFGLACVLASPAQRLRTGATDAIELAMLLVLITMLSPISWFYYGIWLLYPFAVIGNFVAGLPQRSGRKKLAVAGLAVSVLLLNAVFPCLGPLRAVGMPFFGYLVLLIELGWILRLSQTAEPSLEMLLIEGGFAGDFADEPREPFHPKEAASLA